jgi:hypothetical protein
MTAIATLTRNIRGGRLTANVPSGKTTVGNTSTKVLDANPSRTAAVLFNGSDGDIWISLGGTAVVGEGICIKSGAGYEINALNLYSGQINAICTSGGKDLAKAEV